MAPGVNADFAADGTILGLDIEGASRLDLGTLEAVDVWITALKAADNTSTHASLRPFDAACGVAQDMLSGFA